MSSSTRLFGEAELRDVLSARGEAMDAEIEAAPEDHLLHADAGEWADALALRYAGRVPALQPESWWMDPPAEIKVDVRYDGFLRAIDDMTRPALVNGFRIVVHVPFEGDAQFFRFTPGSRDFNLPSAVVTDGEVRLIVEYPADAARDVKAEANNLLARIQKYLDWVRQDVTRQNDGLRSRALTVIQARRQRVEATYLRLQATGIPMGRPDKSTKTFIADVLVRRPVPPLHASGRSTPIPLVPVLSDEHFEHILSVIRHVGEAMERSPKTYSAMGEEDRRQVLLAALNSHYHGLATAEAFNVTGKTDILVRHPEGRNLFIGECKIWEGQKAYSAAIDQLFGYAAWRDTKLALIMFVGERGLSTVIENAVDALERHPQFIARKQSHRESEVRVSVSWPGDDRRLADLNTFFVHIPNATR
jgi:hypothetical protein